MSSAIHHWWHDAAKILTNGKFTKLKQGNPMARHYKPVALDEAIPGMVLSDALLDNHGNVLLAEGVVLTEGILASLRRHRIATLPIKSDDVSADDEEAELVRHEQRLAKLFRKPSNAADDATGLLQQYVQYFRLGEPS
jgi:hypothetical protein